MIEKVQVYVELLNENVLVWRPTMAFRLTEDLYVLSNENFDPSTEEWIVQPGSLVTISQVRASEGLIPVVMKFGEGAP